MGFDTMTGGERRGEDVMAALDHSEGATRLLIADVGRDEAWLSIHGEDAPTLEEWR